MGIRAVDVSQIQCGLWDTCVQVGALGPRSASVRVGRIGRVSTGKPLVGRLKHTLILLLLAGNGQDFQPLAPCVLSVLISSFGFSPALTPISLALCV